MSTIPLFKVFMSPDAKTEVAKVLDSGYIGQGPKVEEFEKQLKEYFNNDFIVTLNSGTSALHLALHLLKKPGKHHKTFHGVAGFDNYWPGIEDGDEVLTTALTCTASNWPILANNMKIKWVDIDPTTLNMDLDDLERKITPKTKVIMVVHWGGYPNDLNRLKRIQQKANQLYGFKPAIIEDGAHSFGTKFDGKLLGNHGNIVMYSLQAIKHITSIDGGLLFLPHQELYDRAKLIRWYGINRETNKKDFRCVHPNTLIRFADGTTEKISKVVKNKIDKEVLVNEDGIFKPTKIKQWVTSELGDRYYFKITTEKLNGRFSTIITNDHKIFTKNRDWKRADEVQNGEEILTSFLEPNDKQKELIIGSLLGDASITVKKTKSNATLGVLNESHSLKQKEYIDLKIEALNDLIANTKEFEPNIDKRGIKSNGKKMYFTKSSPYFGDLRKAFYPNGKKIVNKELVEKHFSDFMLAVWFMDDGRTQVKNSFDGLQYFCDLSTNSFIKEDVEWLVELLIKKGFECRFNNTNGNRIFFTANGSKNLIKTIGQYVPESMRYKVGHISPYTPDSTRHNTESQINEYFQYRFNIFKWETGKPNGYFDKAIITKNENNNYKTTYCLKVKSTYENFQTSAIVVHNCEADIAEWGFKFHMNDVNATVGIENLKHANEIIGKHQANAAFYDKELQGVGGITLLNRHPDRESAFWIYSMLVEDRNGFYDWMKECEIMVSQVHERNDKHSCVWNYISSLPVLDKTIDKVVSIPVGWWVTEEERQYIVDCIKKGW